MKTSFVVGSTQEHQEAGKPVLCYPCKAAGPYAPIQSAKKAFWRPHDSETFVGSVSMQGSCIQRRSCVETILSRTFTGMCIWPLEALSFVNRNVVGYSSMDIQLCMEALIFLLPPMRTELPQRQSRMTQYSPWVSVSGSKNLMSPVPESSAIGRKIWTLTFTA